MIPRMDSIGYYDKEGTPISSMEEWGELKSDREYSRISNTYLYSRLFPWQRARVSTVWLGIDHGFGCSEKPIIFETMAFPGRFWRVPELQDRYATEQEAQQGHRDMIDRELKPKLWLPAESETEEVPIMGLLGSMLLLLAVILGIVLLAWLAGLWLSK